MKQLLACVLGLTIAGAASAEMAGAADFQRCAACHLATGEGIPGAFPPLKGRVAAIAASDEGRAYLVNVVNVGLMGSITVNGTPYMGVMPAQGSSYDAGGISEVLNHSVQVIDAENVSADWTPFTAEEVAGLIEASTAATSQDTYKQRQALLENHPGLR